MKQLSLNKPTNKKGRLRLIINFGYVCQVNRKCDMLLSLLCGKKRGDN